MKQIEGKRRFFSFFLKLLIDMQQFDFFIKSTLHKLNKLNIMYETVSQKFSLCFVLF